MPRLAVALCVLWFAVLFVVRTVVQRRQRGSTGLKGFHGRVGSLPSIAGSSVSLGLLLAMAAPLAALLQWPGGTLLASSTPLHVAGALAVLAGTLGALVAQLPMGDSWRIGVDGAETTALVTTGLFAWSEIRSAASWDSRYSACCSSFRLPWPSSPRPSPRSASGSRYGSWQSPT